MKKLIYQTEGYSQTYDPETGEAKQEKLLVRIEQENPAAADIERAKAVAVKGEYTVEDDGQPAPETADDVLNALLGVAE